MLGLAPPRGGGEFFKGRFSQAFAREKRPQLVLSQGNPINGGVWHSLLVHTLGGCMLGLAPPRGGGEFFKGRFSQAFAREKRP